MELEGTSWYYTIKVISDIDFKNNNLFLMKQFNSSIRVRVERY